MFARLCLYPQFVGVPETERVQLRWTGDVEDDCLCLIGPYLAHCENMGPLQKTGDQWYASVCVVDEKRMQQGDSLFHSGEYAGLIIGGDMARGICESVLHPILAHELTGKAVRLLNHMASGTTFCWDELLAAPLGMSRSTFNTTLYQLLEKRYLEKLSFGRYQRPLS